MSDLSNCPFCDSVMEPFGPDQHNHPRNECWLSSVGVVRREFAAWNRRAQQPAAVLDLIAEVERLSAALEARIEEGKDNA